MKIAIYCEFFWGNFNGYYLDLCVLLKSVFPSEMDKSTIDYGGEKSAPITSDKLHVYQSCCNITDNSTDLFFTDSKE